MLHLEKVLWMTKSKSIVPATLLATERLDHIDFVRSVLMIMLQYPMTFHNFTTETVAYQAIVLPIFFHFISIITYM